jgi:SAM-dependent methyltransferase
VLKPAEVLLLARYHDKFAGRVLEIGCGAGRLLGYLVRLAGSAEGIDVSPSMVHYCRAAFPDAKVTVGDLRALGESLEGSYDLVFASDNILDILDDTERRRVLAELHDRLAGDGLLMFSTHNLAHMNAAPGGPGQGDGSAHGEGHRSARARALVAKALNTSPAAAARGLARLRRERANRRRLAPLQFRAADHAVLNDEAHEYGLLHYYIRRDDQQRQLESLGFALVECLELDGGEVPAGQDGAGSSLYYVAKARSAPHGRSP